MKLPRPAIFVFGLFSVATLHAADPEPPKGFRAIFNGKDLAGWHGLNPHSVGKLTGEKLDAKLAQERAEFAPNWRVEDGELINGGTGPVRDDRRRVRRHRAAHRIQNRPARRQRHLPARHPAGPDLGQDPGLRSQEAGPQTAPGLGRAFQQHPQDARPRSDHECGQEFRGMERDAHPPDRRAHVGVAQ
jgi:hypothetical protein